MLPSIPGIHHAESLYAAENGGRLLVTTSQDEYFVYEMGHFEWKRDRMDNQEAYKICMSREDSAIRKGLIAGFVYDELK